MLPFLLFKFIQAFTRRRLRQPQIGNGAIFFGINQLIQRHAERHRLPVAFGNSETTNQPRRDFAGSVVSLKDFLRRIGAAVKIRQPRYPISVVRRRRNVRIPFIARPGLKPNPVALPLQ